jgi:hypothetical protein
MPSNLKKNLQDFKENFRVIESTKMITPQGTKTSGGITQKKLNNIVKKEKKSKDHWSHKCGGIMD